MTISLLSVEEFKLLVEKQGSLISIVDTRTIEEYNEGHIPGAVHVPWEEWCAKPPAGLNSELDQPGYWGRLFDADDLEVSKRLSRYGFRNDKTIVVYANSVKSKGREGRISWMLLYFGAKDIRILDGGYPAWKAAAGDLEHSSSSLANDESAFVVARDERRRVQLEGLKKLIERDPNLLLLDTRTHREFSGGDYRYMPRMGTLPAAKLIPFASVFKEDGTFIGAENLRSIFQSEQNHNKQTVAFCEVGVRACTVALLIEIYTGKIVPVYDGSMMEWSADPQLPVAKGDDGRLP